jgi:hypothetical protein
LGDALVVGYSEANLRSFYAAMLRLLRQDDANFDGGHVAGQEFTSSGSKLTVFTYRTATHVAA